MTRKPVEGGDRVKYSALFLRAICAYTGPLPFARGKVTRVKNGIASVTWDMPKDVPAKVHVANLVEETDPEHGAY